MGIVDEDIARVRAATDFVHLASEHLALRKVGRRWVGLCPFHAERSPSFSLNAEEGLYYCFGCGAKGDVITFVRDLEHLDFVEAVEKLASRAGIQVRHDQASDERDHQRKARLYAVLERACEWYHQRLLRAPDAAAARSYLRSRGYDGELVRHYRLGWAPEGWDTLARALVADAGEATLTEAGLVFRNRVGRLNDAFRARILFPIFDPSGRTIGFGGRILTGGQGPKYKNTAETAVYSKSRTLYGLNWAKDAVVRRGQVVVCEGYTDVIGLQRVGVEEAVATCGTALAEGHVRVLSNFARRIVLAYDADSAGQAAAERFYAWEEAFQADIAVAALPAGADPADLAASDPDGLRRAIEEARPYLAFRLGRLLDRADLRGPEGRARAAAAAMQLIAEHPNELVRDQYIMQVADRCGVDADRLRAGSWKGDGQRGAHGSAQAPDPAATAGAPGRRAGTQGERGPELGGLRLAVHRPEEVAERLEAVLFHDDLHRRVFETLAAATTLHDAIARATPDVADLLQRLAVEEATEEVDDVMARLIERAGDRELRTLEREARHAADPMSYAAATAWLKLALEDLREPSTAREAEARLVPWLMARGGGEQ